VCECRRISSSPPFLALPLLDRTPITQPCGCVLFGELGGAVERPLLGRLKSVVDRLRSTLSRHSQRSIAVVQLRESGQQQARGRRRRGGCISQRSRAVIDMTSAGWSSIIGRTYNPTKGTFRSGMAPWMSLCPDNEPTSVSVMRHCMRRHHLYARCKAPKCRMESAWTWPKRRRGEAHCP
jgi:hypothetical protein